MEISDKLAVEFNTILVTHTVTFTVLISFACFLFFRAKKSPLFYSYLLSIGWITLWIVSKMLKTLSPTIELRWTFVVLQYFAINAFGICFLSFAYIYNRDRLPSTRQLILWAVPPSLSFIILATNPYHMTFYSYFDIYRDRFGPSFPFTQGVQYLYLIMGMFLLARGFKKQAYFSQNKGSRYLFTAAVLLPLLLNVYYVLFKVDLLPWIFSFPVFDVTPLAIAYALIIFIIPALTFRFFDLTPVSLGQLYDLLPQGIVFMDSKMRLYGSNHSFETLVKSKSQPATAHHLLTAFGDISKVSKAKLHSFVFQTNMEEIEFEVPDGRQLKAQKKGLKSGHFMLIFYNITHLVENQMALSSQKKELERINERLNQLVYAKKELAIARTKSHIAQNVHDILGHSLTVVIGTAELAASDTPENARTRIGQLEEILTTSLNDLKNTLEGNTHKWDESLLIKALNQLKNDAIHVEIQVYGKAYELANAQTEALFRLCQEAVTNAIKHGKADKIYLVIRYQDHEVQIYAIDDGKGCQIIRPNFGLSGIKSRFDSLSGHVEYSSDGESGFTIHAKIPRRDPD